MNNNIGLFPSKANYAHQTIGFEHKYEIICWFESSLLHYYIKVHEIESKCRAVSWMSWCDKL